MRAKKRSPEKIMSEIISYISEIKLTNQPIGSFKHDNMVDGLWKKINEYEFSVYGPKYPKTVNASRKSSLLNAAGRGEKRWTKKTKGIS